MIPAYCVVLRFRINGDKFCPCSLVLLSIVANMSKNSFLSYFHAPFEAKSGAKLQPFLILTKFFWNFFYSKLSTFFENSVYFTDFQIFNS